MNQWPLTCGLQKCAPGPARAGLLQFAPGALNSLAHELIMVTNDTYINACSVCELPRLIAALRQTVPITLILDNARHQSDRPALEVRQKKRLYSVYYKEFSSFRKAISTCLAQTDTTHKQALDPLLSLRFQTFEQSQFMPL